MPTQSVARTPQSEVHCRKCNSVIGKTVTLGSEVFLLMGGGLLDRGQLLCANLDCLEPFYYTSAEVTKERLVDKARRMLDGHLTHTV